MTAGLALLPELAVTALPRRRYLPLRTRAFLECFIRHVQAVAAAAGRPPRVQGEVQV
ncbi:hypothetical protein [uncultured Aquincola sp.]|uniref:hypothetical protein n=1 Tax=uncultured Aquincola sp. TaxID=886556 RepID=UPI0032B2C8E4